MKTPFSSNFKLGILGGGQLGKMLLYNTRKFDIYTTVLGTSDDAPCRMGSNNFYIGDLMDYETVYNFGKSLDVLTVEIEHVNIKALQVLETEGVRVYPASKTLQCIQNKGTQKEFYKTHHIPTAPFHLFSNISELRKALDENLIVFPFVWKSTQFGYDGKGVSIIKNKTDLNLLQDVECIAEALIPFKKELSIIVARRASGETKAFPVVEMEFHPEANQVEYVICPANISEEIENKALEVALKTSEAYNHVGVLAIEMFLTQDDNILVNEVAPRPHNSGHQTIEGNYTCQFEQHIRAILDLPLGSTKNKLSSVMVNLVGEEGYEGNVIYENINDILKLKGVTPHIYGKKETRPFRKMGHVTIVHENLTEAKNIAKQVKETIKVISESV